MATPKKKKTEAPIEEAKIVEVPQTPYMPPSGAMATPTQIKSFESLDLHYRKAMLKSDIHSLLVASTDEEFFIDEKKYSGKENYIVMLGPGQVYVVGKAFFNLIAQIK